jgi:hypothetical protein
MKIRPRTATSVYPATSSPSERQQHTSQTKGRGRSPQTAVSDAAAATGSYRQQNRGRMNSIGRHGCRAKAAADICGQSSARSLDGLRKAGQWNDVERCCSGLPVLNGQGSRETLEDLCIIRFLPAAEHFSLTLSYEDCHRYLGFPFCHQRNE